MRCEWLPLLAAATAALSTVVLGQQPASSVQLKGISGLAVDETGNVYISATKQQRVWKVTPDGMLVCVAGNGKRGYAGDGGPALAAKLNRPTGIAIGRSGDLYIADTKNHRVRKVTPSGLITTVAGTGKKGFNGDGGPAVRARLRQPFGVAVDSRGNLFVADTYNWRIRKVAPDGVITTWRELTKSTALALAIDRQDNLYLGLFNRVEKITSSGEVVRVAGTGRLGSGGDGGKALAADLSNVLGLAVDHVGNVYISDQNNVRIRRVSKKDEIIHTVTGDLTFDASEPRGGKPRLYSWPSGLAVDGAGNLYFSAALEGSWANQQATGALHRPTSATEAVILQTISNIASGVTYGKNAIYLPWSDNKWVIRMSTKGDEVVKVAGK